jgi:hypothetical protein
VDAGVADSALTIDELGSRIVGLAGRLAAATCRWLLLVADFDARDGCARFGLASSARWVSHYCGLSHRTALEHVRVARALAAFAELRQAMSAGRLSYSHVRAISRLARDGEEQLVSDLVGFAEHATIGQLETMVRGLRTVQRNEADCQGVQPDEYVTHGWTAHSQWRMNARLDPEHGAVVQSGIETLARSEGLTHSQALVRMAEIALAALSDSARPARELRGDERAAIVVHLDTTSIGPRSMERGRHQARIDDGPGLPDDVVERLLCAGRIRTAVHDRQGNVRDLGRSHRVVSDRMFRALLLRDTHCAHPGCTSRAGLQAHHVKHWIDGGRTDLANLVLLCERHHHQHHDGAVDIVTNGEGRFQFVRADGRVLPAYPDPAGLVDGVKPLEHQFDVADDAAHTRWGGERLDRLWAISVLAQRRANARTRAG